MKLPEPSRLKPQRFKKFVSNNKEPIDPRKWWRYMLLDDFNAKIINDDVITDVYSFGRIYRAQIEILCDKLEKPHYEIIVMPLDRDGCELPARYAMRAGVEAIKEFKKHMEETCTTP